MKAELHWPGPVVEQVILVQEIGKFLRTHRNGWQRLLGLLDSVAADRTEDEYRQELERALAEHEARVTATLERVNAHQAALGRPPINRKGEFDLARNRKQSATAQADQDAVADVLHRNPRVTAKQTLRVLGWPSTKLSAVRRHLTKLRKA